MVFDFNKPNPVTIFDHTMQDDPPQDELDESQSETSDASGIIEDNNQSGVYMEGGLSLEGGEVKAWDVDLGEFLKDVEDDPNAATLLGTANEFDLDAGLENDIVDAMHPNTNEFDLDAENPSAHVSFGGESDFDIERDAGFGEEVQSNSYVSSEEESIISAVYPVKQSKIVVVASVCFVAFVSLIASNRRKLILFSLRLLALLLVTWILFILRG